MSDNVRITRANARSFAQISLDRSMSETLGQELFDVRRIARIFRTAAKSVNVGLDLTDIRNIRRENGEVVILVKNTAQHAKLRQMLPRLKMALEDAGFRDPISLRIKPPTPPLQLRENLAFGAPRVASGQSVELIRKKAESMKPSALKDALASLANALEKANSDRHTYSATPASSSFTGRCAAFTSAISQASVSASSARNSRLLSACPDL